MSTIKANVVQSTTGGATTLTDLYPAKAWVNFNGRNTVAIRADGNVSSITDNGSGDYTANFSNALVDANYAFLGCLGNSKNAAMRVLTVFATSDEGETPYTQSSTAVRFVGAWSGTSFDAGLCYVEIAR